MSQVKLTISARLDLDRLYSFLAEKDVASADRALATIISSFDLLESIPLAGNAIVDSIRIRKHVISFGNSGYIALYHYNDQSDIVSIDRIYHQKEDYREALG